MTKEKNCNSLRIFELKNSYRVKNLRKHRDCGWLGRQLVAESGNSFKCWISGKESLTESSLHPCVSLSYFLLHRTTSFMHSFIYLHSAMPITHSDIPTFLSALFSYQTDIQTMDKTHKYNPKLTAQFFIPSGKSYLIHEFHSSKC